MAKVPEQIKNVLFFNYPDLIFNPDGLANILASEGVRILTYTDHMARQESTSLSQQIADRLNYLNSTFSPKN